ncbi:MAG TPA: hypothetical protein VFM02_03030 [Candidatus Paceibacterota bacterium]|nr:hypothetical protein [Candidatus Paceibacterota bacterium]
MLVYNRKSEAGLFAVVTANLRFGIQNTNDGSAPGILIESV